MKIKEIYDFLDSVAPFSAAEDWDNCGVIIGNINAEVSKIFIALDVTERVIEEALAFGAELVITHHPIMFSPVKKILSDSVIYKAVLSGMTFIASHTCLDIADGGVNDCLAEAVGIKEVKAIDEDVFLKIGKIKKTTVGEFAVKIKNSLGGGVSYTLPEKEIETIAFCSGSGGDLITLAKEKGADALLTGEAKHHQYLLSNDMDVALFVAGHYETENIVCEKIEKIIKGKFGDNVEVKVSSQIPPVNYI